MNRRWVAVCVTGGVALGTFAFLVSVDYWIVAVAGVIGMASGFGFVWAEDKP